jgi:hypothetical protein
MPFLSLQEFYQVPQQHVERFCDGNFSFVRIAGG